MKFSINKIKLFCSTFSPFNVFLCCLSTFGVFFFNVSIQLPSHLALLCSLKTTLLCKAVLLCNCCLAVKVVLLPAPSGRGQGARSVKLFEMLERLAFVNMLLLSG